MPFSDKKPSVFFGSCHPYFVFFCILSCLFCAFVMIWGAYAMRADMREMADMRNIPTHSSLPNMMNMNDPLSMSMRDMGTMLEGKTGDTLDKAFLEAMIPHHQGAVDMAKYLVNAKHPELQKMGQDIILAQEKEIAQMKQWLRDWGYEVPQSSFDPKETMMIEHCKQMPEMQGCELYK